MDFFKGKLSSLSSRDAVDGVRADSNGARQANAYANAGAASNSYASSALQELRRRLEDRNTWIPDAVSSDCYSCQAKFTTIRRKHHCRMCGQIFCSKCCGNFIAGRPLGFPGARSHLDEDSLLYWKRKYTMLLSLLFYRQHSRVRPLPRVHNEEPLPDERGGEQRFQTLLSRGGGLRDD